MKKVTITLINFSSLKAGVLSQVYMSLANLGKLSRLRSMYSFCFHPRHKCSSFQQGEYKLATTEKGAQLYNCCAPIKSQFKSLSRTRSTSCSIL